ncbi:MAG: ABC transporter ATP-binding protein [Deltaproteobacteria bacterium]|nr:ABC transporter ATP-binding protein [Deltaproteobacteria bacterium]
MENVSREYDNGKIRAVRNINLEVLTGEFIVLLGSSGSGKTTLLNLMTGLDTPTSGRVYINGKTPKNGSQWSRIRSQTIGFIFQSFNLIPTLTARENVEIPMFGSPVNSRQREKRASFLLEKVGLSHRTSHLPSALSGGERQRVAIARSLANRPALLMADEPTGNLDSKTSARVMDLIYDIHVSEKNTLVVVTHDRTIAEHGDRIIRISDGRLIRNKM